MTPADVIRPRAYSYVRFSTPEQREGDSLRRQTEKAQKYAAEHGLILDDKLNMHDLGVSAFRGANVTMGALGDFLSLVQSGDIQPGSYLLAENVDRISRNSITEAMAVLTMLINSGITLVTLTDGRAWSREIINAQPFAIMEIIMGFIRANDESARKAGLLKDAWHGKRIKLAEGRPLTSIAPTWLTLSEDRTRFEVIGDKAAIVRRVFDLTAQGIGQHKLARQFNQEGVPPLGTGAQWHGGTIARLIRDEAVIGRFTPRKRERDAKGKVSRPPAGETITDYFPAIVDAGLWEQIKAMQSSRVSYVAKGAGPANILAGLATCPTCGARVTRVHKKGGRRAYMVCIRAKTGAGCEYKASPYPSIEDAVVDHADDFLITMPSPDEGLEDEWQRLLADDEGHAEALDNIVEAIKKTGPSDTLLASLRAVEADREAIKGRLVEVGERVTASLTNRVQQTVARLVEVLEAEERDVAAINAIMRQLFEKVEVDRDTGRLRFHWKHAAGATTEFIYMMEPATPEEIARAKAAITMRKARG